MTAIVGLIIALALPLGLGAVWLRLGWRQAGAGPAVLGYGYLAGMLAATQMLRLVDGLGLGLSFPAIAAVLAVLTALAVWLGRALPWRTTVLSESWRAQTGWEKGLWLLFAGLIVLRLGDFAVEIALRPLYPWDAWTTWAVRPRVWLEYKKLIPFVDPATWLAAAPAQIVYTIDAWQYRLAVSLIYLWTALGFGHWNESVNNLPWLLCALALGLGFYGQARLWGARPLVSLLFTYLLLSMPLVNAHIALAGYADLWLATAYGFAAMALFQWLRYRDRCQGLLALGFGLACVVLKAEGAVWLLTFIPALLVARLAPKKLLGLLAVALLLLIVWFALGGFTWSVPGLGEVRLTPELIQIPGIGRFALLFAPEWGPFIQNMFVLANWHLLWYLAVALVLFSIPVLVTERWLLACSMVPLTGLLMLFVLFFMTEAHLWAAKYTSINRLFLHLTPALLFYLLILFQVQAAPARRSDTAPSSAAQPG